MATNPLLDFDPDKLAQQQADVQQQKSDLALQGGITDNLANRHSAGEFFLGQFAPRQNSAEFFKQKADAIADPLEKRKQLLAAYQETKGLKDAADDQDPNSARNVARRESLKSQLQGAGLSKLAGSIGDNMNAESLANLEKMVGPSLQSQTEIQKTAMQGKNELSKLDHEYQLKRMMGLPLGAQENLKLSANSDGINALDEAGNAIAANKDNFGPIAGRIAGLNPTNEAAKDFENQRSVWATKIGTALGNGQLNGRMFKNYLDMLPKLSDEPEVASSKVAALKHDLLQKHQNDIAGLRAQGFNVNGLGGNAPVSPLPQAMAGQQNAGTGLIPEANAAPSSQGQFRVTKDGATYQKVPGGWKKL